MAISTRVSHSRSGDYDCVAIGAVATVNLLQRLLTFKNRKARSPYKALRLEPLEARFLMSIDGFSASVSPDWFGSFLDSEAPSHVNAAGLSIDGVDSPADKNSDDDIVSIDGAIADQFDWIVQFDTNLLGDAASASETNLLLNGGAAQFEVVFGLGLTGQVLVRSSGSAFADVDTWLEYNEYVASYELDVLQEFQLASDDPNAWRLWGLDNYGQTGGATGADIDAREAWDISTGSSDIVVAVIDTGVDYTHPDLAANIWTNPGEIAGNGIDDDGNGFVDDIHGYDFANNDGNPMDDHGHGTHVSGTIAAAGNNGTGVVGVNWSSSIMGLKFLSSGGSGYTSNAVRAVNYATMMRTTYDVNVRVTNNSWGGGGYSTALNNAIRASGDAGILFVAAAGNNGTNNDVSPHYPSNYNLANVLAVAATDHNDRLAYFSCYGATTVDLAAPGVSIYSTTRGGSYGTMSGTSMATPHVAGVAALAWSVNPDATVAEIRSAILRGTDSLGALAGKMVTGGRLNAFNTLQLLEPVDPGVPTISSLTVTPGTVVTTDGAIVTLTAHDVVDSDGSIAAVYFYADTNADGQHDAGDQLVATVNSPATADVTATIDTTGFAAGTHRYFARAVDNEARSTLIKSTVLLVVAPDDHGNDSATATAVAVGSTTDGMMDAGDIDWFSFEAVAGTLYSFEATLLTLEDSVLYLYDQDGNTLIDFNDDFDWPSNLESRIFWEAGQSGTYYLAVESYDAAGTGQYQLGLTAIIDDHGGDAANATAVALGSTAGTIDFASDQDWFAFEAIAGTLYRFETTLTTLDDSVLYLYDQDGNTLIDSNDDYDWWNSLASRIFWEAGQSGTYYLAVESYDISETGQYELELAEVIDDHGGDAANATAVAMDSTTNGFLDFENDQDWFAFEAVAGVTYRFDTTLTGLEDSWITLYNQNGVSVIDYDDDGGVGWASSLTWTAGQSGTYYIAVEAYAYYQTGSYSLDVVLEYSPPTLDPIADQSMAHNQDTLAITLAANDLDGDPLSYTAEAFVADPLEQLAYDLDQDLGLYRSSSGYYTNLRGAGEKYLIGNGNTVYLLMTNGELRRWGGSIATSTLVATLDSTYHADPTLLHEAQPPSGTPAGQITVSLSGNTLTIDPADGFAGDFQIRVGVSDGVTTVAQSFDVTVENHAPTLAPIADQSMAHNEDTLTITLAANDADGDPLSYTAEAFMADPLEQLAYDLDQDLGLYRSSSGYYTNLRGAGEKYLIGSGNTVYLLMTNGELRRWGGSIAASTLVATLDSTYYADPTLLHEAQPPSGTPADQITVSLVGNTLTIDPADGFLGSFQVRVGVSDGVTTVAQSFDVTVDNHAPTLDPIADQTMSHNDDTLTITLAANDADGDPLSYTAEAFMADPMAQLAYDLDQGLGLYRSDGGYFTNYRGVGEKYLIGNGNTVYLLMTNGELRRWGGSIAASTLVATLDSTYYADPTLLHVAQPPSGTPADQITVSLSGNTLTIDPADGFLGSFQVRVGTSDGVTTVAQSFDVTVENQAPTLDPIADQTMSHNDDTLTITLAANDADGDPLSYTAEALMADPMAQLAYDLDQDLGLYRSDAGYYTNYRGVGEKYLIGNGNTVYLLMTNGELRRWGGSVAASTLVATLDSTYYADPTLLHEAQAPSGTPANLITVSLVGNTLTIDPADGFLGSFQIRVGTSDGVTTVTESFDVTVENHAPTLDPITDRTMPNNQDTLTITLAANDLDGDPLSYTAAAFVADPMAQLAYDLDQDLGLYRSDAGYYTNYRGVGERYLIGNGNTVYLLMTNGELRRWGGSIATSTLVATLDSTYHADPTLLHEAQVPSMTPADQITVSLSGNTLTIDPADGFVGTFQIRVGTSDGVTTVMESFDVTVTDSVSQASIAVVSSESESAAKAAAAVDVALSEPDLPKDVAELLAGVLSEDYDSSAIDKYFDSLEELVAKAAS